MQCNDAPTDQHRTQRFVCLTTPDLFSLTQGPTKSPHHILFVWSTWHTEPPHQMCQWSSHTLTTGGFLLNLFWNNLKVCHAPCQEIARLWWQPGFQKEKIPRSASDLTWALWRKTGNAIYYISKSDCVECQSGFLWSDGPTADGQAVGRMAAKKKDEMKEDIWEE